jgi:hypothetical protein
MKCINLTGKLLLTSLALTLMSWTALADPPGNDTVAGATQATIGFSEVLDTSEATTDSDDSHLNEACGFNYTDASVWYVITASADGTIVVDASQSNYSAGMMVAQGSPGNLTTYWCGGNKTGFDAWTGEQYYVLIFDTQEFGEGNGGSLNISFAEALAPVLDDFTVNRIGRVDGKTGIATISGTYTCSNGNYLSLYVDVSQTVGRIFIVRGSNYFENYDTDACDGLPQNWSLDFRPYNGKFAGGKALTATNWYICTDYACAYGDFVQTIQLRNGK